MLQIDAFSDGKFSASGREGAQVAPNGKVYYENEDVNLKVRSDTLCRVLLALSLKVAIYWSCAGWTSPGCSNSATVSITGKQAEDQGLRNMLRFLFSPRTPERADCLYS